MEAAPDGEVIFWLEPSLDEVRDVGVEGAVDEATDDAVEGAAEDGKGLLDDSLDEGVKLFCGSCVMVESDELVSLG